MAPLVFEAISALFRRRGGALEPRASVSQALTNLFTNAEQLLFANDEAWHYYQGDFYDWIWTQNTSYANKRKAGLYRDIAPYFNPVTEIVDVDADKVFSPPVHATDCTSEIDSRLNDIWTASDFMNLLYLYVQTGAAVGTTYLHVIDGKRSVIDVKRPDKLWVYKDPLTGQILVAMYQVNVFDPLGLEVEVPGVPTWVEDQYTYRWVMTKDAYATFKNEQPWAFSNNPIGVDGLPQAIWRNILGVVPVVECQHQATGDLVGHSAWQSSKPTIDATNTIASAMANTIKMHIDPLVIIRGLKKDNVQKELLNGQTNVWYLPLPQDPSGAGPTVELLEWQGQTSQVQEFVAWVKDRLTDVIPELQLTRIQEQTNPSGLSVALQSSRLVSHIERLRANYTAKLVQADRLAMYAEDVHQRVIEPDPVQILSPRYQHSVQAGPVLPRDLVQDNAIGTSLYALGLIDAEEMLTTFTGYSSPQAQVILDRLREKGMLTPEGAPIIDPQTGANRQLPNGADITNPAQTAGATTALREGRPQLRGGNRGR